MLKLSQLPFYTPAVPTALADTEEPTLVPELPNGVLLSDGRIVKTLTPVKSPSALALSVAQNKDALQAMAPQAMAQILSHYIESIDDVPVVAAYRASDYKEIPEVILNMLTVDAGYALVYIDYYLYGDISKGAVYKCTNNSCRNIGSYDIPKMYFYKNTSYPPNYDIAKQRFTHKFSTPAKFTLKQDEPPELYDYIEYSPPNLRKGLLHRKLWDPKNELPFIYAMLLSDATLGNSTTGSILDKNNRKYLKDAWLAFPAKDRVKIVENLAELPQIYTLYATSCEKCGDMTYVTINPLMLLKEI